MRFRIAIPALIVLAGMPAFAHGEQILVFPASFALLLLLGVVILAIPWHRWWARAVAVAVLLGSNVALWFSPIVPQTVGALAVSNLRNVMLMLLVIPMAVCAAAIAILIRIGRAQVTVT